MLLTSSYLFYSTTNIHLFSQIKNHNCSIFLQFKTKYLQKVTEQENKDLKK